MEIAALSSGSSGNCFYIGDENLGILVDVGISAKKVIERLEQINVSPQKIKAIFVTHEHIDHVRGVDVLARKLNLEIYATRATANHVFLCSNKKLIKYIDVKKPVNVGCLRIEAFSKTHSAVDPVSYNIYGDKKVSIITDAGHVCQNIKSHVSDCDFLCIESNHDEMMLEKGPYPFFLKKWVKSDSGHLSNKQAALCILEHGSSKLNNVVLAHLSGTNNTPDIAIKTFKEIIGERTNFSPSVHVSIKDEPTRLFRI